jgi:hypothetical protein
LSKAINVVKFRLVNAEEIRAFLQARPFVPFRIYTSDGQQIDINHPEMGFVTRMMLYVGKPVKDPTKGIPVRADSVSTFHSVRLQPLVVGV